jgi:hypothetical protein
VTSGFIGAMIASVIAIALPGPGTSGAQIDPNRYGVRTVDAAGGSVANSVTVRFTVRPVIVLVVDAEGAPRELWTNLPGRPSAADLAGLRVREGSITGPGLTVTPALRAAAAAPLAAAHWGGQGRIWLA